MRGRLIVLSITLLLGGCGAGKSDYDVRFFEKYLLDGERAMQENDNERAERMFRISLSHGEKLGPGDWRLAVAEGRLAKVLLANDKTHEARKVLASSVAHFRGLKSDVRSRIGLVAKEQGEADSLLGMMLVESGDINASRSYLEEASALLAPFWPPAEQEKERDTIAGIGYARALYGLARVEERDGDTENAVKNYKAALSVIDEEEIPVPMREDIADAYAALLRSKGKFDMADSVKEAQDHYARFHPGGQKAVARDRWRELFSKARDAAKQGNYSQAFAILQEAYDCTNVYAKDGEDALNTLCELGRISQRMKNAESATKYIAQAEAVAIKLGGEKSLYYDNVLLAKNKVLRLQKKNEELEAVLKKQIALREELRGKDNFHVGEILSHLGECQFHLNKPDEGEASLRRAIAIFKLFPQRNHRELEEAYDRLIAALEKEGKVEQARKLKFDRAVLVRDTINWESKRRE
ncbi:MAG: tetratricopeptide repeat protein [Candidatus Melainabacteria bacterium]|jgi:tetratricopeptide (TPR) repeat protein|nr:tetratricopeptide repeat protein [Candidatus Melainabacteria bacterium]